MTAGLSALLYRIAAIATLLFVVYALSKGFAWLLDKWGPDARARRGWYAENANRLLVKARIAEHQRHERERAEAATQLIEQTKTRPRA